MGVTPFTVHSTAPDAAVIFYPYTKEDISSGGGTSPGQFMETTEIKVQKDILSVSTSKGKGGVGTFQITLASNTNWKAKLAPGSWCMIYLSDRQVDLSEGSSASSGLKMVGIVRSIRRQEVTTDSGFQYVRYMVSGDDFQSMFNAPIYLNANLEGNGSPVAITIANSTAGRRLERKKVTADFVLTNLIENLLGPMSNVIEDNSKVLVKSNKVIVGGATKPILVPSDVSKRLLGKAHTGHSFTGMVSFFLQANTLGETIAIPAIGGVTPIWGLLDAFSNKILNEIYTDLLPVSINGQIRLTPSFVLRSIPFSQDKMDNSCIQFLSAPEVKQTAVVDPGKAVTVPVKAGRGSNFYISKHIKEHEMQGFSSGKSDAERFNFFFVIPNVISGNAPAEGSVIAKAMKSNDGISSLANTASLQRYGLRPFIAYSQYYLGKGKDTTLMNNIARDMWAKAHLYENGQVTIRGCREHIPVGTNVKWEDRGWVAHVERVDHSYQINGDGDRATKTYRTTIAFSRLQTTKGKPIDLTEDSPNIKDGSTTGGMKGDWDRGVTKVNI